MSADLLWSRDADSRGCPLISQEKELQISDLLVAQFLRQASTSRAVFRAFLRGSEIALAQAMEAKPPTSLLHGDITEKVIGIFYDVYNELGPGFPEFVFRRAMAIALAAAGFAVREEKSVPVWFRGIPIVTFRLDLVIEPGIVIEVKTSEKIEAYQLAQVRHYLKATEFELGLLLNFGRQPRFQRVVFANARKRPSQDSSANGSP